MPTDSKAKRSRKATPPSTPASNASADQPLTGGRLRRVLLLVGLVIIAVGIWPAWRRAACAYYLSATREAMERREFDQARDAVRVAERYSPNSAEAHFLKAVVARRGGQLSVVEDSLRRAEELGWPTADIHLQRLLLSAQVGRVDDVEE